MADAPPLRRMVPVLGRGLEEEAELRRLIDQQQEEKSSSTYHRWLTLRALVLRLAHRIAISPQSPRGSRHMASTTFG